MTWPMCAPPWRWVKRSPSGCWRAWRTPLYSQATPTSAPCVLDELTVREQALPQRGRAYKMVAVPASVLPVATQADVLVIGGGSSGAVAAIAAAQEGVTAAVVDMNPGLGGTGTYGGINTYWFARRIGFVDQNMSWMDEMHDRLQVRRPEGTMAHWNVEARVQALREQAERTGVATLLDALVFGTIVAGAHVRGAVLATPFGPVAALGRVTLDATGDADVAAWAGADTVYGSAREHAVMWGYMPQLAAPDAPRNVKTSMIDTTNIVDYNRMIRAERRRALPGDYDHGVYLGPRESRHIRGDVVMTLTDHLVRRAWPDVVYIAFSNYDMKGEGTSDWVRMGIQPPNLTMEVSYRSLVPNGVEDILVVGKAFSADHDASAAPRMQPDLENLGGAAAVAAALALAQGILGAGAGCAPAARAPGGPRRAARRGAHAQADAARLHSRRAGERWWRASPASSRWPSTPTRRSARRIWGGCPRWTPCAPAQRSSRCWRPPWPTPKAAARRAWRRCCACWAPRPACRMWSRR